MVHADYTVTLCSLSPSAITSTMTDEEKRSAVWSTLEWHVVQRMMRVSENMKKPMLMCFIIEGEDGEVEVDDDIVALVSKSEGRC